MFDEATLSRRVLLKRVAGTTAALALPGALAACGGRDSALPARVGGGSGGAKERSGRSRSAPTPPTRCRRRAYEKVFAGFKTATGGDVKVNTVDHDTFQERSTATCRARRTTSSPGSPATACSSSPQQGPGRRHHRRLGQRRRQLHRRAQEASTGDDGKQYFVPFYYYPWARLLPQERLRGERLRGPDDARRVQGARQADEEGRARRRSPSPTRTAGRRWARSTILNMRVNGYDFHMQLMEGEESWTGPEGQARSSTPGAGCCRYHQPGALGRTWQEAAQSAGEQEVRHVPARHVRRPAVRAARPHDDLDFFTFPEIDSNVRRRTPSTRRSTASCSPRSPRTRTARKALLKYLATGRGAEHLPASRTRTTSRPPRRRHVRLQRAAEEGRRADRRRAKHHAVHGPRHPARLRLAR